MSSLRLLPLILPSAHSANVNVSILTRNIRFVAESLAKSIYGLHEREVEVFAGSLGVSDRFVSSWLRALTENHRVELFGMDSALLMGLERVPTTHTKMALSSWVIFNSAVVRC